MDKDIAWKTIIVKLFDDFLEFFFEDLLPLIDRNKKAEFLDNELAKLFPKSEDKNRRADKLIKLYFKDGQEKWFFVHTEVQGYKEEDFSERMFTYFYLIWHNYRKKIVSLAIFADNHQSFKPDKFEYQFFDTGLLFWYRNYKILEQKPDLLKESDNPFSVVILAAYYGLKANSEQKKYDFKKELFKLLLEKGYSFEKIDALFNFIDVLIKFRAEDMEIRFNQEVEEMAGTAREEDVRVGFSKYIYDKGMLEGKEEGKAEGIAVGEARGELLKAKQLLIRLLEKKFNKKLPRKISSLINNFESLESIEKAVESIFDLDKPEDVLKILNSENS